MNKPASIFWLTLAAAVCPASAADPTAPPRKIQLRAATEPDPPLRLLFWPPMEDRINADAMPLISRALLLEEQTNNQEGLYKNWIDFYNRVSELPLEELPTEEVENQLGRYSSVFQELERAENLMRIRYDLRTDDLNLNQTITMILPEYQNMRNLGRLLRMRMRLAAAGGRWEDFCRDARLQFRLVDACAQGTQFLVVRLIGWSIASGAFDAIQEATSQPDCPNLYWALASLPIDSLTNVRDALEFESTLLLKAAGARRSQPTIIGEQASINRLVDMAGNLSALAGDNSDPDPATARLLAGAAIVALENSSRQLLEDTEGASTEVSAAEAVLKAIEIKLLRSRDNWSKWIYLPDSQKLQFDDRIEQEIRRFSGGLDPAAILTGLLVPAVKATQTASLRVRQQHAILTTLHGIRMHAAATGQLPETLEALKPVPAWPNPFTGQLPAYIRHSDDTAMLSRTPGPFQ